MRLRPLPFSLLLWVITSMAAYASQVMDQRYQFKTFVVGVANTGPEPVYSDHVEHEMARLLKLQSERFEISPEGTQFFREFLKSTRLPSFANAKDAMKAINPALQELEKQGVNSILLAEIIPDPDSYKLAFSMIIPANQELLFRIEVYVSNRYSLEAFSIAIREGLSSIFRGIPFDATVIRREGYRVIVDRGFPALRPGMELPAFTIELAIAEDGSTHPRLEETGTVVVTKVEQNLSFGRIIMERKPLEISSFNKIRLPGFSSRTGWKVFPRFKELMGEEGQLEGDVETLGKKIGYVDVKLGTYLLNLNHSTLVGPAVSSSNLIFPGGSVRTQVWLTHHVFMEFGYVFGMGTIAMDALGTPAVFNANISEFKGRVGYRFFFSSPNDGPTAEFKLGYAKQDFRVDVSPDPISFTSTTYDGLQVGASILFPITRKFGIGFNADTILLGGFTETPWRSGDTASPSSWDLKFQTYLKLNPAVDVDAKIQFQSNSTTFTGSGNRPLPVVSESQMITSAIVGLNYYF